MRTSEQRKKMRGEFNEEYSGVLADIARARQKRFRRQNVQDFIISSGLLLTFIGLLFVGFHYG